MNKILYKKIAIGTGILLIIYIVFFSVQLYYKLAPYKFLIWDIRSEEQINNIYKQTPQSFDKIVGYLQNDSCDPIWIDRTNDGCYIADTPTAHKIIDEHSICETLDSLFTKNKLQLVFKNNHFIFFVFDTARNFEQGILWTDCVDLAKHQSDQTEITQLHKIKDNFYWYQGK